MRVSNVVFSCHAIGAALLIAAGAVACGPSDEGGPSPATQDPTGQNPAAAKARDEAEKAGGTATLVTDGDAKASVPRESDSELAGTEVKLTADPAIGDEELLLTVLPAADEDFPVETTNLTRAGPPIRVTLTRVSDGTPVELVGTLTVSVPVTDTAALDGDLSVAHPLGDNRWEILTDAHTDHNARMVRGGATSVGVFGAAVRSGPPPDTAAPQTTLNAGSGPAEGSTVSSTFATFGFTSDDPLATFECSLDAAPFAACTSPATFFDLTAGAHTFAVRAVDAAGNADATPATRAWSVAP